MLLKPESQHIEFFEVDIDNTHSRSIEMFSNYQNHDKLYISRIKLSIDLHDTPASKPPNDRRKITQINRLPWLRRDYRLHSLNHLCLHQNRNHLSGAQSKFPMAQYP